MGTSKSTCQSIEMENASRTAGRETPPSLMTNSPARRAMCCAPAQTTMNRVNGLREYQPKEGGPKQDLQWRPWRKGIAGLHRRAEISQKVRRRVRALRPWGDDQDLLAAINHGDFLIRACRHRDLQRLLYCTPATSDTECRRRSATIRRKLGLLKAHALIRKIQHNHRYQIRQRRPDHPRRRPDDGPHYPPADQPVAGGGMTNSSRPQKKLRFSSTGSAGKPFGRAFQYVWR